MALTRTDSIDHIDWQELADLYLAAPLARTDPALLHKAFANSMFTRFAFEDGRLAAAGRVLADGVGTQVNDFMTCQLTGFTDLTKLSFSSNEGRLALDNINIVDAAQDPANEVPEPAPPAILGLGPAGMAAARRYRR